MTAPNSTGTITIRLPTSTESHDQAIILHVSELINNIYLAVEINLLQPGTTRTNPDEVEGYLSRGEMYLVFDEGVQGVESIIGTLSLYIPFISPGVMDGEANESREVNAVVSPDSGTRTSASEPASGSGSSDQATLPSKAPSAGTDPLRTASFGILTVLPAYRSTGLGRRLIQFAEDTARAAGCSAIKLDLLVPEPPMVNESKEMLKVWYKKLGYRFVKHATLTEVVGTKAGEFLEGTSFWVMVKDLS